MNCQFPLCGVRVTIMKCSFICGCPGHTGLSPRSMDPDSCRTGTLVIATISASRSLGAAGGEAPTGAAYPFRSFSPSGSCAVVSQIAQTSGGPMIELSTGAASASTRGAQGRARLQNELAAQKGTFFTAVLAAMARRMQPTASVEGSPQELLDRGICGSRYLKRFGSFAKVRELNFQAARDQTALLAVAIDQAALDQGRFELSHPQQCSATGR